MMMMMMMMMMREIFPRSGFEIDDKLFEGKFAFNFPYIIPSG